MQVTQQDGVLYLKGDATVFSITREDYRLLEQLPSQSIQTVDLSGIASVDSSCVALLLAIKRKLGTQTNWLQAAPPAVAALLQLYELEWLS